MMEERDLDFRALEYVSPYDNNLMCPICRSAFVDPVVVSECDHHFCRECLAQTHTWSQHSGTCPTCRRSGRLNASGSASKLLVNILDDLVVKCPNSVDGCEKQVKRGQVLDHVTIYCPFSLVDCPRDGCDEKVRRKDAAECLHLAVSCLACRQAMTLADLDTHWHKDCPDHDSPCPCCAAPTPYRRHRSHLAFDCPEKVVPCPAQPFGCPFTTKRHQLSEHSADCPLAKVAPYLAAQQERQDEQDAARQVLQKRLAQLQRDFSEYKASSQQRSYSRPTSTTPPQDQTYFALPDFDLPFPPLPGQDSQPYASPTQHLLSLHENLREEVSRQANTIHEVDTRLSMMLLNENMRLKDELAYQGAQLSALMRQVGWLTNARLQGLQPSAVSSALAGPGPSEQSSGLPRMPMRRTTDEGRTKL